MEEHTQQDIDEPVWARPDSFPLASEGHGWMDPKGQLHPVDGIEALLKVIGEDDSGRVILVWHPGHSHLVMPEELDGAEDAVRDARSLRMEQGVQQSQRRLWWGSAILLIVGVHQLWSVWSRQLLGETWMERLSAVFMDLLASIPMGIGMLLWFALVFMPWYEARKDLRLWQQVHPGDSKPLIPTLRFDTWLQLQRAPVTRVLAGVMLLIWLLQWAMGGHAIVAAGLVKPAYHAGEYWRLLTAPWLHGNWVHFMFNLLALLYLGKRVELFARWPHLLTVLLFSTLAGGMCSAYYLKAASVGISGGLMGWLGFLLVFETLHQRLVTRNARRRLLAAVLLTALMGLIGYRFIDNAAHIGGLLAGMLYGWIVFPFSASTHRPKVLGIDRLVGVAAALGLAFGTALTLLRLLE